VSGSYRYIAKFWWFAAENPRQPTESLAAERRANIATAITTTQRKKVFLHLKKASVT
jgi:hypothetical protein